MPLLDSDKEAYAAALRYIGFKPRTQKEVSDKLRLKKFPQNQIDRVVRLLADEAFLDDAAYARAWAMERIEDKKIPLARVRQELKRKGVAEDLIEEAMAVYALTDPVQQALEFMRAKYARRLEGLDEKKVMGAVLRRGFSYSAFRKAWKELTGQTARPSDDGE